MNYTTKRFNSKNINNRNNNTMALDVIGLKKLKNHLLFISKYKWSNNLSLGERELITIV